MDYLDFVLEILDRQGREYQVAVQRAPAGGTPRANMRFPFGPAALDNKLLALENAVLRSSTTLRSGGVREQAIEDFGRSLFDALFSGDIRSCYDASRLRADQEGKGLRLVLRIQDPKLAALPWEFLYDRRQREFICLVRTSPVVRYVEPFQTARPPLAIEPPLRILGMVASPTDLTTLDVESERQTVTDALADLRAEGLVDLTWLDGQTARDLQSAMLPGSGPWHVLHFIGHGDFDPISGEGKIILADRQGRQHRLGASGLARLLTGHYPLTLVILNACYGAQSSEHDLFSSTAASLVLRGIPAVLAMQYAISDQAAIEFTSFLYRALARGMPIDAAVAEARIAISTADTAEWATPVLFTSRQDGRIFDISTVRAPHKPATDDLQSLRLDALDAFHTRRWEVAARLFGEIVGRRPDDRDAATRRDEALRQVELERETRSAAEQARELAAKYAEGLQLLDAGQWAGAIVCFESVAGRDPAYRQVEALLAEARRRERPPEVRAEPPGVRARPLAVADNPPEVSQPLAQAFPLALPQPQPRLTVETLEAMQLLRVHRNPYGGVTALACSPDGQLLASASTDQTIRVWRRHDWSVLQTLSGHTGNVWGLAFAANGQLLASGGDDKSVRLWDPRSGELVRALSGHTDSVKSVAFSADGRLLASASHDHTVRLWNPADGALVRSLGGHTNNVQCVAFSPGGELLASASDDQTARLWRVSDGTCVRTLSGHSNSVLGLAFAPDGETLATCGGSTALVRWGGGDCTVRLWRIADGRQLKTFAGHVWCVKTLAYSPDGKLLASGGEDHTIRIWHPPSGELVETIKAHPGAVLSLAFSPDGRLLLSGGDEGGLHVRGLVDDGRQTLPGHHDDDKSGVTDKPIGDLAFSPDGSLLACGSFDHAARIWRLGDQSLLLTLTGHQNNIRTLAFSPDGQVLATASDDQTVRLWRRSDGVLLKTLAGHGGWVRGVAFSPDGSLLASSSDSNVRLWHVGDAKMLQTATGHQGNVHCVAFSPDGTLLASGADDTSIRVWRVPTLESVRTLSGHTAAVMRVAFSPDGTLLASASADSVVRVWRAADGELVRKFEGHTAAVLGLAFSPDGRQLASSGVDWTVRIWSVADGTQTRCVEIHGAGVRGVAFAPDGATIASGSDDGMVRLWRV